MRDRYRAHPGPWLAAVILACVTQAACQTSMSEMFDMDGPDLGDMPDSSVSLPLGSWTRDNLHCEIGRCERWFAIEVDQPGMLRVDVYAPVGDGLPDCELSLETEDREALNARTGRVKAQRRLRYEAPEPGIYRLRLASKGSSQDRFDFEVVAELSHSKKAPSAVATTRRQPAREPERPDIPMAKRPQPSVVDPAPTELQPTEAPESIGPELAPSIAVPPPPEPVWVVAEVLDVEETAGRPSAVMVEAGVPDGIGPGMQGELFEGDAIIGRIEVVDVYPTGSRAKILGELSAPVSFDTFSRIEIPNPQNSPATSGE
jgi:hypothetical protein